MLSHAAAQVPLEVAVSCLEFMGSLCRTFGKKLMNYFPDNFKTFSAHLRDSEVVRQPQPPPLPPPPAPSPYHAVQCIWCAHDRVGCFNTTGCATGG